MAEPPAKRQRLDMVTTIVVRVGEPAEQQDFTILLSFATKSSKFMQTTFGGEWRESHERRASLPEMIVSDFEVYLEWLYTGHVVTLDVLRSLVGRLLRLYVLGDFLIDDRFCDAVVDALIDTSRPERPIPTPFRPRDLNPVWSKTVPGSLLRKVLVDLIILEHGGVSRTCQFLGKFLWSKELMAEVFTRIGEHRAVAGALLRMDRDKIQEAVKAAVQHPSAQGKSHYHKHGKGYPSCP